VTQAKTEQEKKRKGKC